MRCDVLCCDLLCRWPLLPGLGGSSTRSGRAVLAVVVCAAAALLLFLLMRCPAGSKEGSKSGCPSNPGVNACCAAAPAGAAAPLTASEPRHPSLPLNRRHERRLRPHRPERGPAGRAAGSSDCPHGRCLCRRRDDRTPSTGGQGRECAWAAGRFCSHTQLVDNRVCAAAACCCPACQPPLQHSAPAHAAGTLQVPPPTVGAPDHHVAVVCIRRRVGAATPLELRVGIVGNVDSGKTTMVCSFGLVSNRIMSSTAAAGAAEVAPPMRRGDRANVVPQSHVAVAVAKPRSLSVGRAERLEADAPFLGLQPLQPSTAAPPLPGRVV